MTLHVVPSVYEKTISIVRTSERRQMAAHTKGSRPDASATDAISDSHVLIHV